MNEEMRRIDMSHFDEALRVHRETFREDLPLLKILHFSSDDLSLMFKHLDRLF
ncbi:MAG: hypothetical protein SVM80_07515 [Halobacteriota archaeon]|nr:hypothetical protein [Halobacteriota archaeon]